MEYNGILQTSETLLNGTPKAKSMESIPQREVKDHQKKIRDGSTGSHLQPVLKIEEPLTLEGGAILCNFEFACIIQILHNGTR